ncbi:transcriptional regulator, TetR family [Dethiosulfatibacter aminovorans DSM 17477]|uniref:Transcriptional regulator, TetR family n=1 Tax=Dethiosulfatibacter aminovorans DSM 17477 TaxID=1121476 RepID=A0A1M6LYV2_9FIRM|nr:TetR/AcrR family transcriptional regulator [Dethiosulfatibacter aminovorans]SHJ76233.1 transcriptional regulator, TetR family [Dethiosulfatibacter aminovorans DSM 17477]
MDKSILTKAKLLKTAVLLFEEHGYTNTTIRMIAQKANVGRGNVTYYFKKKDDILRTLLNVFFNKIEIFTKDIINDINQNAYVYFAILLKSNEHFIDTIEYFKMMTLDTDATNGTYRHNCDLYYELIEKKLKINNTEYDSAALRRSINFAVLIYDDVISRRLRKENEYNVNATSTAIRHFLLEMNYSDEVVNKVLDMAEAGFRNIDLNEFNEFIMGYEYEEILRELEH